VDIDISKEKFMEMEVVNMSDFEILSLMIGILSIIVKLLLEIIKENKNNYLTYFGRLEVVITKNKPKA
ncbi:hypothetical protein, partial [Thomasclavelia sp.]|uniref:hypothetical protein n=1 Tax=Thomasclavelia sp. TaxID=3025757 RepID=UPI0025F3131A